LHCLHFPKWIQLVLSNGCAICTRSRGTFHPILHSMIPFSNVAFTPKRRLIYIPRFMQWD
jgi:hypothetical protein